MEKYFKNVKSFEDLKKRVIRTLSRRITRTTAVIWKL